MPQRSGLGKGLDALIPAGRTAFTGEESGVTQVAVDLIQRNPRQPRENFDIQELENLATSIREHGVIQPLIVAPGQNGIYILIAGERRLQASRKAGLKTVPVVIRHASDQQLLELALIENVQRADLNAIEEAEAYQHLEKEFKLSHEDIAARVGKNRSTIANTVRLLEASAAVKQALVNRQISGGHARAMLKLSARAQDELLNKIILLDLSVRTTEMLAKKYLGQQPAPKKNAGKGANLTDVERRLQSSLGTRVSLKHGKTGKGTVTIYFYSDEELDSLLEKLT